MINQCLLFKPMVFCYRGPRKKGETEVSVVCFYVLELESTEFGYLGLEDEEWPSNIISKCLRVGV